MRTLLVSCIAGAFLGGCATTMNDSAPGSQPGLTYVVGSKQGRPAVWLCSEKASNASACQAVEVEVSE